MIEYKNLKHSLFYDEAFFPLLIQLKKLKISKITANEMTLLCYYFLTTLPNSLSLISSVFTEVGTKKEKAARLSQAVYIARTERDGSEPDFIMSQSNKQSTDSFYIIDKQKINYPSSLTESFIIVQNCHQLNLKFDNLPFSNITINKGASFLNLSKIDETGFLIEDEEYVFAGLAVTITEIIRLSTGIWPGFYSRLLNEIPLSQRDFYSLGRLLAEKQDVVEILIRQYRCCIDVIYITEDNSKLVEPIEGHGCNGSLTKPIRGIPVFLRIKK